MREETRQPTEGSVRDGAPNRSVLERTRSLGRLLRAVFAKQFTIMFRYRVNLLAQLVGVYLFFALLFFGGQVALGQAGAGNVDLGSTLDGLIVGWFLWTTAMTAYSSLPSEITTESEWGTLEQLYLSPHGFGTVMLVKAGVKILQSVFMGAIVLLMMLVTTRRALSVDVLTVVPIVILALCSLVGIGLGFAGLALIYKRVQNVNSLMNFVIIGLVAAPVASASELRYLPLVQGSAMLQRAMQDGVRFWEFPFTDSLLLLGTALVYLVAGFLVFQWCSRTARTRGVMGHY